MSRLSQVLAVTLALVALTIITTSCSSTPNVAQVRIINAIPDGQPVDIYANTAELASSLPFDGVNPAPGNSAQYLEVSPGSESIQGFAPGDNINPISPLGTVTLEGSTQYTLIAVGLELNESPPLALVDNNSTPPSGKLEIRIINVSPSSPSNGVDVYFVSPGTDITQYAPQIGGLSYEQTSLYQPLSFMAGGYEMIITAAGGKTPLIDLTSTPATGSITTVVLVDNVGGNNGMSRTPLVLNDLK
jgi:hypothetical protein